MNRLADLIYITLVPGILSFGIILVVAIFPAFFGIILPVWLLMIAWAGLWLVSAVVVYRDMTSSDGR